MVGTPYWLRVKAVGFVISPLGQMEQRDGSSAAVSASGKGSEPSDSSMSVITTVSSSTGETGHPQGSAAASCKLAHASSERVPTVVVKATQLAERPSLVVTTPFGFLNPTPPLQRVQVLKIAEAGEANAAAMSNKCSLIVD